MSEDLITAPEKVKYLEKLVAQLQPVDYVQVRLLRKTERYKTLGARNRKFFYWTSGVAIIAAAIVPVLITLKTLSSLAVVLSLTVTILVSMENLFHFREHWRNYDNAEEALRRQQFMYGTRSGLYEKKNDEEAFHLLVSRVEEIIQAERHETIQMRTADQRATELADQVRTEIKALHGNQGNA